jgi:glutamate-1-semialdehyde 2,1-aminomutase/neamine transaminase/2'-deamino-2'-hydroxyneamine transaminase/neomycin C transaminase
MRCANRAGCLPYGFDADAAPDIVAGRGCYLFDRDGKRYIDLSNAFGSVMLGHADPDVSAAAAHAITAGVPAGVSRHTGSRIADRLATDLGAEVSTAFFKTGTTAVRAAVCAARRATRRPWVASAGFHGWDVMWTPAHTPFTVSDTGVFDFFYCADALAAFLDEHAGKVAAVVISPDYLHIGPDHLRALSAIARAADVLTIFDEVKYGYRFGPGPSVHRHGITGEVYVFAKGLANGWPLACVTGTAAVMSEMSLFTSTLAYSQVELCAAEATLAKLASVGASESIAAEGGRFVAGVRERLVASRLPLDLVGTGHAFQLVAETPELEGALVAGARRRGLVLQAGDQQMPSWSFTGDAVGDALDILERVLTELAARFSGLCGVPLSKRAQLDAAWSQMDGLPAVAPTGAERTAFLTDKLAVRQW